MMKIIMAVFLVVAGIDLFLWLFLFMASATVYKNKKSMKYALIGIYVILSETLKIVCVYAVVSYTNNIYLTGFASCVIVVQLSLMVKYIRDAIIGMIATFSKQQPQTK